jgi:hypothetical protein
MTAMDERPDRLVRWTWMAVACCALVKVLVLGTLWWRTVADAESPATEIAVEAITPDALVRAQGFRTMLEEMAARGASLDRREQQLATRQATVEALESLVKTQLARLEACAPDGSASPGSTAAPTH